MWTKETIICHGLTEKIGIFNEENICKITLNKFSSGAKTFFNVSSKNSLNTLNEGGIYLFCKFIILTNPILVNAGLVQSLLVDEFNANCAAK
jgi:hypothetical protein